MNENEDSPTTVAVYGPNLPTQDVTFHIHRPGCRDTRKMLYRGQDPWTIDVTNMADIVEAVYPANDFQYDPSDVQDTEPYLSDIRVFSCVSLPFRDDGAS